MNQKCLFAVNAKYFMLVNTVYI